MKGAFNGAKKEELLNQFKKPKRGRPRGTKLTAEEKFERRRQYYMRTRQIRIAKAKEWQARHPDRVRENNRRHSAIRKAKRREEPKLRGYSFSDLPTKQRIYFALRYSKERQRYMYFAEYQALARRTQNFNLSKDARFKHAMFGMMSELGEVAGIYQKEAQGHRAEPADVIYELGDLLWFVAEFCDVMGFSMEEVAKANIKKLKTRYPEGFDAQRSLYREE